MDQNISWIDNPCFKSKGGKDRSNKNEAVLDKDDLEKTVKSSSDFAPKTYDRDNRDFLSSCLDPNRLFDSLTKNFANGPRKRSSIGNSRKFSLRTRIEYMPNEHPPIKLKNRGAEPGPSPFGRIIPSTNAPFRNFRTMTLKTCGQFKYELKTLHYMRIKSGSHVVFLGSWPFWVGAYKNLGLCNSEQGSSTWASISDHE